MVDYNPITFPITHQSDRGKSYTSRTPRIQSGQSLARLHAAGALINPIRHILNRTNSENELRCPMTCPCIWFFCSSGGNRTCESSHDEHTTWLRLWLRAPEIVPFRCETDVIGNAHAHGGHGYRETYMCGNREIL